MGMGGQRHASATLPPGKTRYPFYRRLGGLHTRSGRARKISLPPGFDLRTVHPVASRYTDWAIPAHRTLLNIQIKGNFSCCLSTADIYKYIYMYALLYLFLRYVNFKVSQVMKTSRNCRLLRWKPIVAERFLVQSPTVDGRVHGPPVCILRAT